MKKVYILLLLLSPCVPMQAADWISSNLPEELQVDQQWRDQVKLIQQKTGTSTPIIFIDSDREWEKAAAVNVGVGPCRFAVMFINQSSFQKDNFHLNIQALTHESEHIDQNHGGPRTAMNLTGIGMIGLSPALKVAQLLSSTPLRAGKTLGLGLSLTAAGFLYPNNDQQHEHEAEKGSLKKLGQLGHYDTLENLSDFYASKYNTARDPRYPTFQQMHEWSREKCSEYRPSEMNG